MVTRGKDQRLALGRLGALVEQLEALLRSNRQMILVSSGSVSVGKQKLRQSQILNSSPLEMQMAGSKTVCSKDKSMAYMHKCCAVDGLNIMHAVGHWLSYHGVLKVAQMQQIVCSVLCSHTSQALA